MFGVTINGRAAILASQPGSGVVEEAPGRWLVDIPNPGEIADISVFLMSALPTTADGQPTGLGVYFATAPFQSWEFLTALSNLKPSVIVNAGWSLNPAVNESRVLRLGISIEPASALLPKMETVSSVDFRRDFARKIALNLFRFIESFSQGPSRDGNFLRCPQDVLDRWLSRFDDKYSRDPNFILKTT